MKNFKTIFYLMLITLSANASFDIKSLSSSSQLIIVHSENENTIKAKLSFYEKEGVSWKVIKKDIPAVLGKNGISINKKEGDGKTPSGIFSLGQLFGKNPSSKFKGHWEYTQVNTNWIGVDDPNSKSYNQIIQKDQVKEHDWKSHEELIRKDHLYNWFLVIDHNLNNTPGNGSLIFLHVWRNANSGTAGCVAIEEKELVVLLTLLKKEAHPKILITTTTELEQVSSTVGISLK